MEFSRQEYWSGLPFPFPGDLPKPGIEHGSFALQVNSLPAEPQGKSKNAGWVAYPFSRGSSQTRNWTGVYCIAGRFFTNWATRQAHECESWTIKKAEHWRIDAFELWCWRRLLRVTWTTQRSNQSILGKSVLNILWKDWYWTWNSNTLATWCEGHQVGIQGQRRHHSNIAGGAN